MSSPLTRRLIQDGLKPSTRLTDAQALVERLEGAIPAGASTPMQKRRLLAEAARFIREQYGLPVKAEEQAA